MKSRFLAIIVATLALLLVQFAAVAAERPDVHRHSHEATTQSDVYKCNNCGGNGVCWTCRGVGGDCSMCNNTRVCYYCAGKGTI